MQIETDLKKVPNRKKIHVNKKICKSIYEVKILIGGHIWSPSIQFSQPCFATMPDHVLDAIAAGCTYLSIDNSIDVSKRNLHSGKHLRRKPCVINSATAEFHYFRTTHEVRGKGEGAN